MKIPPTVAFANIHELMKTVDWPVMPEVGQALIRTFKNDDADLHTVEHIIAKDPALTVTLLRMANSALFGLSGQVDTLERAINVVGMSQIRARALAVCMARLAVMPPGMDRTAFWHYSLLCAGYAHWLAGHSQVDAQEAWLIGMMLRLGELSLCKVNPMLLSQLQTAPMEPGDRWLRQRQLLGFDEGQVMAELATHWDFPAQIIDGLRQAAQPLVGNPTSKLAAVLHLAARLADSGKIDQPSLDGLPLMVMVMVLLKLDAQTLQADAPDVDTLTDTTLLHG